MEEVTKPRIIISIICTKSRILTIASYPAATNRTFAGSSILDQNNDRFGVHFNVFKLVSGVPPGNDLQGHVKCTNTFAEPSSLLNVTHCTLCKVLVSAPLPYLHLIALQGYTGFCRLRGLMLSYEAISILVFISLKSLKTMRYS